jgi:plastocyanin
VLGRLCASPTPIARPSGRFVRRPGDATVRVNRFSFDPPLVSIPRGATVRWRFRDDRIHDATLVRGPRGFATPTVRNRSESQRFTVPGEYRLYCSIHPVLMSQVVRVR